VYVAAANTTGSYPYQHVVRTDFRHLHRHQFEIHVLLQEKGFHHSTWYLKLRLHAEGGYHKYRFFMRTWIRRYAPVLSIAAIVATVPVIPRVDAQRGAPADAEQGDARLPNGKSQRDEILKSEHEQNLKDAAQLIVLSEQLKEDLEKNDRFVVSMATLKKTDDIEKLVRKIRTRLRHN
jgi:hypothetical protein